MEQPRRTTTEARFHEGGFVPRVRKVVGPLEATLPWEVGGETGFSSKVYEVLQMERLEPFQETPENIWQAFLGTIAMCRFAEIRDFGPDNLGLRPVQGRDVCQCVFTDSGSWEIPALFCFPSGWKATQFWRAFQRTLPEHLEPAKQLVLASGRSLGILMEEGIIQMHGCLPADKYQQVLFNLVEQGALSLSPLGRTGFAMPEERLSERTTPTSWKIIDLKIPAMANWWSAEVP